MMVSGPKPFFLSNVGATPHRSRRKSAMPRCFEHSTDGTAATSRTPAENLGCAYLARNAVTVWPHGHCGTGRLAFRVPRPPGEYRDHRLVLRFFLLPQSSETHDVQVGRREAKSVKLVFVVHRLFVLAVFAASTSSNSFCPSRGADRNLSSGPSLRHVVVRFRSTFARPFHQFSVLTRRALVLFLAGGSTASSPVFPTMLSHVPLHVLFLPFTG